MGKAKRPLTDREFAEAWMDYHAEVERTGIGSAQVFSNRLGVSISAINVWRRQVEHRLNKLLPPFPGRNTPKGKIRYYDERAGLIDGRPDQVPAHLRASAVPDGFKVKGLTSLVRTDDPAMPLQWIKADPDAQRQREAFEAAVQAMTDAMPRIEPVPAGTGHLADLLVGYPMGDPHIGMLAWAEECGDDWDLAIAERVHCQAMADLVASSPPADQALIVNLGDFLHYDSMAAVTPRSGHMLDADGRYSKMIRVGIRIMRRCIDSALLKHRLVRVVNVQGNHDETGARWLSAVLAAAYEDEPRVTIDDSPALFHYHAFGANLIGMHHGHTCKPAGLPGVMAADRAEEWGRAQHRYWWTGHVHHESIREYPGVTVETFNTLAAKDAYATAGGWRSRRLMQSIVLHREGGIQGRHIISADAVMARAT